MQQIEDLTLLKYLGKGSFGEVYLSTKKGRKENFATKKIDRKVADKPSFKKYFDNEIKILSSLNHPNIVKLEEVKKSKNHYYIVMEYINGGGLSDCLQKYMKIHNKAFPEEIVQYLMRQIIEGLNYIHSLKIIHRDLKLDNIMVSFDSDQDKEKLNMMKAKIKIIDFGFAIQLTKGDLTYSAVGSPINMDPIILKKFSKNKGQNLGYDEKADIWSIGTVCYELLIGKAVFNAETMNDLVEKVEKGSYSIPKTVSKEVVSFLNGMLQYDSKYRLSSEELLKHPFLTKRVSDFDKMDTAKPQKKDNFQKNRSIWAIFNDEEKYVNIQGGKNMPAAEGPVPEEDNKSNNQKNNQIKRMHSEGINHYKNNNHDNNINNNDGYKRVQSLGQKPFMYNGKSFYGQSMHPNDSKKKGISPYPQPIMQQMGMPQMMPQIGMPQQNMANYPSFGVPMAYPYGGMYQQTNYAKGNYYNQINTENRPRRKTQNPSHKKKKDDDCNIY